MIPQTTTQGYATVSLAPIYTPPPPPGRAATPFEEWSVSVHGVKHIDPPAGMDPTLRYFEGWGQLTGVDLEKKDSMTARACEQSAADYLQRNPVICWHHDPNMPIGKVLSLTFTDDGMYLTGFIYRMDEVLDRWKGRGLEVPVDSIALKCEEVWESIVKGYFGSFSVRGSCVDFEPTYSPELQQYLPRYTRIDIIEISVAPIAQHPGTRIVAANTLAKALEVCKALPLRPNPLLTTSKDKEKTMSEEVKNALITEKWAEFQALLAKQADADGNVDLPEDVSKALQVYGGATTAPAPAVTPTPAVELSELSLSEQVQKAMEGAMAPVVQRLDALEGKAAPLQAVNTVHTPEGASVKPVQQNTDDKLDGAISYTIEKAIQQRMYGPKEGEKPILMGDDDLAKLMIVEMEQEGWMVQGPIGSVSLSANGQQQFSQVCKSLGAQW